jgi:hypothetical protein
MSNGTTGWITVLLRLPVFYNPDAAGYRAPVEDEKFLDTADELARRFGGGALFIFRHDPPRGFWWDQGVVDRDVLALIEVDVPDTRESREWLRAYARDVLRERFRQKAIYLKFVGPVEHLVVNEEEIGDENWPHYERGRGTPRYTGRRQEACGARDALCRDRGGAAPRAPRDRLLRATFARRRGTGGAEWIHRATSCTPAACGCEAVGADSLGSSDEEYASVGVEMERVYLDQKDFSRMAQGLSGATDCAGDREAYEILHRLVGDEKITVYFSWGHIVEGLRYKGNRTDRLQAYCKVVDTLTKGHCLLVFHELQERELEVNLAQIFDFPTELDLKGYAYGKYADALTLVPLKGPDMKEQLRTAMRQSVMAERVDRNRRAKLLTQAATDTGLRALLDQLPDESFREAVRHFPFLPADATRDRLMRLIFASGEARACAVKNLADNLAQFRYLMAGYEWQRGDVDRIAQLPDADSAALRQGIETA